MGKIIIIIIILCARTKNTKMFNLCCWIWRETGRTRLANRRRTDFFLFWNRHIPRNPFWVIHIIFIIIIIIIRAYLKHILYILYNITPSVENPESWRLSSPPTNNNTYSNTICSKPGDRLTKLIQIFNGVGITTALYTRYIRIYYCYLSATKIIITKIFIKLLLLHIYT